MDYEEVLRHLQQLEQNEQLDNKQRLMQIQRLLQESNELFGKAENIGQLVLDATFLENVAKLLTKIMDQM